MAQMNKREQAGRASAAYKERSLTQTNLLQFPQAKRMEASLMIMHCFHTDADSPWRVVRKRGRKRRKGKEKIPVALAARDWLGGGGETVSLLESLLLGGIPL